MYFPQKNVIFLHIPKTGGNFVSNALVHLSDAEKVLVEHQDGFDRFTLSGPVTRAKHQSLADYARILGARLADARVYAVVRPPIERLLSQYFSPHQWMEESPDSGYRLKHRSQIQYKRGRFRAMMDRVPSICAMLDRDNLAQLPRIGAPGRHKSGARVDLLDFARLEAELARFMAQERFDGIALPDRKANVSAVPASDRQALAADPDIASLVLNSPHAADLDLFGRGDG